VRRVPTSLRAEHSLDSAATRLRNGWQSLALDDLAKERDRLRAEGFPPDTIRAIIAAQIAERDKERWHALETNSNGPFWKSTTLDPKQLGASRELSRQERAEVEILLGRDPDGSPMAELERRLPQLSAEKRDRVAEIIERYADKSNILSGSSAGGFTGDEFRAIAKSKDAEIEAVLTPAEFKEYEVRIGDTANQLANQLGAFNPTEDEFRAVVQIRDAFVDQLAYKPNSNAADWHARQDAEKRMNDQIAAVLGADRYAEYQRATDYSYQQTKSLVDRLGLPNQAATDLYNLQKEFQSRMREANGAVGNSLERARAFQAEAAEKVTAILGGDPKTTALYQQYGGAWLRSLAPAQPH
jgi:hypothetical protein